MIEVWKTIDNFSNYKISNLGRVKSNRCLLKPLKHSEGYYYVCFYNNKKCKLFYIHRLVAMYFIDNPLNKRFVNHKDTNKRNNIVTNLEWTTHKENMEHACLNNLIARKERQGLSKLNDKYVAEIRRLYKSGLFSQRDLANKFDVCQRTIAMIIHNITWKE